MNEYDPTEPNEAEEEPLKSEAAPERPALVINIHSWATPVLSVVMLVFGLALGYFGRPLIQPDQPAASLPSQAQTQPEQVAVTPAATDSEEAAASRQEMMDFLITQTKHFKGDPNATVTIIEFSDYQ